MKKICFVTASPLTLKVFMRNHLLQLSKIYDVTVVSNFTDNDFVKNWPPAIRQISISISRKIDLLSDMRALVKLILLFRKEQFDAVHSITPKAGLLAMISARLVGICYRVHCFTGQVWVTRKGFGRRLLKQCDCFIAAAASHILVDSFSQKEFLEHEKVLKAGEAEILGFGSISGVDVKRFRFDKSIRSTIRGEFGIPSDVCLLLFVGRLNRDKGILDLAQAFKHLSLRCKNVWLLIVGPDEDGVGTEFDCLCGDSLSMVRRVPFSNNPEYAMSAADVFVLPSYREGFGSVVIEAAACGLPTVASRIYGLTDAVEDNITGLLHQPGDISALQESLLRLCTNRSLRHKMGRAACQRVHQKFSMSFVTASFCDFYKKLFAPGQLVK